MPQVSLVPTLSLLLGLPIPFGNTGSILPNLSYKTLFPASEMTNELPEIIFQLAAYEVNIYQVTKYLKTLTAHSSDFPSSELNQRLDELRKTRAKASGVASTMRSSNNSMHMESISNEYSQFLRSIRSMCVKSWATFDMVAMLVGFFCFAFGVLSFCSQLGSSNEVPDSKLRQVLAAFICVLTSGTAFSYLLLGLLNNLLLYATLALAVAFLAHYLSHHMPRPILKAALTRKSVCLLAVLSYNLLSLSNSFVIHEDKISSFFACSVALLLHLSVNLPIRNPCSSTKSQPRVKREHVMKYLLNIGMLGALICCLRLGGVFYKCREEQGESCVLSPFIRSIASLSMDSSEDSIKMARYIASVSSVLVPFLGVKYMLGYFGNMNGYATTVFLSSYFYVLCPSSLAMTWTIQALPSAVLKKMPGSVEHAVPIVLCSFVSLLMLSLWIQPLMIYLLDNSSAELQNFSRTVDPVRQIFQHLKFNWRNRASNPAPRKIVVYGLSTVYSACMLTYVMCIVATVVLLTSDGLALAYGLCVVSIALVLLLETTSPAATTASKGKETTLQISLYQSNTF